MDNGLISLDETPVSPQINLGEQQPPLPDPIVQSRATKADIGLSRITNQDYDSIYQQISGGQEPSFRGEAAANLDAKAYDDRQKALTALAAQKGRMLTLDEVNQTINGTPPTNPDTVIEKAYSEHYMRNLEAAQKRIDDNILTDAKLDDPDQVERYFNRSSDVLSRLQYANTVAENLSPDVQNDAYFHVPFPEALGGPIAVGSKTAPWWSAANWATMGALGGIRNEWLMRGNTPETSRLAGIFEANNVREQALELLHAPTYDDFKDKFDKAVARIKSEDPSAAQQWAASIAGMSTDEMITRDAMSTANVVGAAGLFSTVKSILGGVGRRQVQNVGRPMPPSSGNLTLGEDGIHRPGGPGGAAAAQSDAVQAAQSAVEDTLRANPASPTKANIAEATGDTREAAVQRTVNSRMTPDPQKDAVDTLFDMHRSNQVAIRNNPGSATREEHTRMLDAGDGWESDLSDSIVNTSRVVRNPALAENGFRDIADRVPQYFRGAENTVANVDTVHDPIANTETHIVTLTNYDGRPFTSQQQALNHARSRGYGNPVLLGNDPETVYLPPEAVLKPRDLSEPSGLYTGFISPDEQRALHSAVHAGKYADQYDKGKLRLYTDHENKVHITARNKPKLGDIPVSVMPDGKVKYGSPVDSFNDPNTDLMIQTNDTNGFTRFLLHDKDGQHIEVIPSVKPQPHYIPYNLKSGKFGQPLAYGPHIEQKGLGYVIKYTLPMDETQSFVRDALIGSPETRSASNMETTRWSRFVNGVFGYLRNPHDTLSRAENANRAKVVYTPNRLVELAQKEFSYVEKLYHGLLDEGKGAKALSYFGKLTGRNKQIWEDFVRALVISQKYPDPETKLPGYYFKTPYEIQKFWQRTFNRPASIAEQEAYLAVQRMDQADWIYRNIAVKRNKDRLGIQNHVLISNSDKGEIRSAPVEGRLIQKIPQGDRVVAIHNTDGSFRFYNALSTEEKRVVNRAFIQGQIKGIQLYDPDSYPVKIMDKNGSHVRVGYILSRQMESSPTTYKQVGYRGGGHWDYNYSHFIAQPMVRKFSVAGTDRFVYSGDATFAPIANHADGVALVGVLNDIKNLLKEKNFTAAKALHQAKFDQNWKDFVRHFYPRKNRDTGEIEPARFNFSEDFAVRPKGLTLAEYDKGLVNKWKGYGKFVDATRQENMARNYNVEFTGARDSWDLMEPINKEGTIVNPTWKFQPATLTDPVVTQTRALQRMMDSVYGDDYRISAAEHWLQENMSMLNSTEKEVRSAPMWHFMHGDLTRAAKWSLRGRIAEANRYKIKKLIGMPTETDMLLHSLKQEMADALFESSGITQKALVVPSWMLDKIHSPVNFVRAMAFHEYLGFWNWQQIAAQNMAQLNIWALSPGNQIPGSFGAWMHMWSKHNQRPEIISHLGQMAENFGWKPGEWEEAWRSQKKIGFGDGITNTIAISHNRDHFQISPARQLLRKGTSLFELAESNVAYASWYAAFKEYKNANPTKPLNDLELGKILDRANFMYMNMGRDSRSMLNTGVLSVPLQFFKYIENAGQNFFSKRIGDVFGKENTWQQRAYMRARMFAMYSLVFGPLGATGLSLLPINDINRKTALGGQWPVLGGRWPYKDEYVPGDDTLQTLLMEGPTSYIGALLSGFYRTGKFDAKAGTFYNFNNRWGVNGYQIFRDLLEPSSSYWKIMLGAGGTALANTLSSLSPWAYAWKSALLDEQDNPFKIGISDWQEFANNISSIRNIDRLQAALRFGKWIDKHGGPQQDIGAIDAVFRTLTGANDVRIDDAYLKNQIKEDQQADYHKAEQEFQKYRRIAEQAALNNNPDEATNNNRKALFMLQYYSVPSDVQAKIMSHDAVLNKNSIDKTNDSYYLQQVPTYRTESARKAFRAIQGNQ